MKDEGFSPCAKRGGMTVKVHGSTHYYGGTYTFVNNKCATRKEDEKHQCTLEMTAPTHTCDYEKIPRIDGVCWSEYKWCKSKLILGAVY